jgi:hypothetical protein
MIGSDDDDDIPNSIIFLLSFEDKGCLSLSLKVTELVTVADM